MTTVTGVFRSKGLADHAALRLRDAGVRDINLIAPDTQDRADSVATTATEQPGMGKAVGGVVGAAVGIAGGWEAGVAAASAVLPGVGPVVAAGIAAATLLGVGGALGGAAAGAALEDGTTNGLPEDELYVYKDALRKGRSVLFAQTRDRDEAVLAREIMEAAGAETIDAARDEWWIGLRAAEREHYQKRGHDFGRDEHAYRRGFESAVRNPTAQDPPPAESAAFRRGYERGKTYRNGE
jgi:hypothetical protein